MENIQMGLVRPISYRMFNNAGVEGYPCHGADPPADYQRMLHLSNHLNQLSPLAQVQFLLRLCHDRRTYHIAGYIQAGPSHIQ